MATFIFSRSSFRAAFSLCSSVSTHSPSSIATVGNFSRAMRVSMLLICFCSSFFVKVAMWKLIKRVSADLVEACPTYHADFCGRETSVCGLAKPATPLDVGVKLSN